MCVVVSIGERHTRNVLQSQARAALTRFDFEDRDQDEIEVIHVAADDFVLSEACAETEQVRVRKTAIAS